MINRKETTVEALSEIADMSKRVRDIFYRLHSEEEDMENYNEYIGVQSQLFKLAESISAEQGSRVAKDLYISFTKQASE